MTKGKQITICFHLDDCKVSYASTQIVNEAISWLHCEYKSIFEDGSGAMVVHCGHVHTYLGTTIDFSSKGLTKISMIDYVKDIVSAWDDKSNLSGFKTYLKKSKGQPTAAPPNLFTVDETSIKLSEAQKLSFTI
jgi:hypothetical protein